MKIIIETKNIELTDSLSTIINKRFKGFTKFEKLFGSEQLPTGKGKILYEIFVEIEKETKHHRKGDVFRAEAILNLPGKKLVARTHGENLVSVISDMRDELEGEIMKYKTKSVDLPRRKHRNVKRNAF